jgi:starch phosphorylase
MPTQSATQAEFIKTDVETIKQGILKHLTYTVCKEPSTATERDWFNAIAYLVRDYMAERWIDSMRTYYREDVKRVYYLSLEFLTGRVLINSMMNLGIYDLCYQALEQLDISRSCICELEPDPALGNGGLGRLAACFLDSMASLNIPGYGYGIRYEYGMFYQRIHDGQQLEQPDNWLRYGNPWEFPRPEMLHPVHFGGHVVEYTDEHGRKGYDWRETEAVMAMAYDIPVAGYGTNTVNNLRLWAAKASRDFHLEYFNKGNYFESVRDKNSSENLSKVLYPDDSTEKGRELRLKQEYFFVSASLQDILRRYLSTHDDLCGFPDKIAIQLNDTHPALAVPDLMRLLLDKYRLDWDTAWDITVRTFSYTNHTLLPEALETWSIQLFETLLPRHLQIIYDINSHFLKEVNYRYPGDMDRLRRMSLIGEDGTKHVRMGHLAVVGSHKVNGVAQLHTNLMKETIFADFDEFFPGKLINKTNGITPRRWLNQANHSLAQLIHQHIGKEWLKDLSQLRRLLPLAENVEFQQHFQEIKYANKQRLSQFFQSKLHLNIDPNSLFDIQIKRIHEYKRQLLNLLHVITRYNRIRANPHDDILPRTVVFAGKAAPGYYMAKQIIRLINNVAEVINNDPVIGQRLKVIFVPNYNVSLAELMIPAADLSEQISTAGMEASGTGNMKFALNGALTIGTLDGANVEIRDEVGAENIFIFGLTVNEVKQLQASGYNPWDYYHSNRELQQVLDMLSQGYFTPQEPDRFKVVVDALLLGGDRFMLLADYAAYVACQTQVDQLYRKPELWWHKAILNVANMGKFSSDRTIREYAEEIWQANGLHYDGV